MIIVVQPDTQQNAVGVKYATASRLFVERKGCSSVILRDFGVKNDEVFVVLR
jgi:hypothetical protein